MITRKLPVKAKFVVTELLDKLTEFTVDKLDPGINA